MSAYTVSARVLPENVQPENTEQNDRQPDRQAVTRLLQQISTGNKEAFDELMPVVYDQLRKLAARCLLAEHPDHTLRATALVHEAYLRLVDSDVSWQDRIHFYSWPRV